MKDNDFIRILKEYDNI